MKKRLHESFVLLKKSFQLINGSNPLLLSAATAFFTTFALSPILINLSHLLNLFFDKDVVLPKLFAKVSASVGEKAAHDIQRIVDNFLSFETNVWLTIFLSLFFYFVGTTLLTAIRQSIHQLWSIKKKPEDKMNYHIKERLIEIAMILLIGVMFLISLALDSAAMAFQLFLENVFSFNSPLLGIVLNAFISVLMIATWITLLFRLLPEAHVRWRVAIAGGIFTAILFNIGRFTLTKLLVTDEFKHLFGPSSSMALLLLFIFYCSLAFYFGASFTYVYAESINQHIRPGHLANQYVKKVVEVGTKRRVYKKVKQSH